MRDLRESPRSGVHARLAHTQTHRTGAIQMSPARGRFSKVLIFTALSLFVALPATQAQEKGDLDAFKWRVDGNWWYSHPSGSFRASADKVEFDIDKDFNFGSYSTFSGGVDWHFKRKHHFTFDASPVNSTKTAILSRDITFRGVTYHLGATVTAEINSLAFAPGYQWDFIRRRQGYLALATSFNLLNTEAKLTGVGTVDNVSATRTASNTVLAPLPVLGMKGRWYPIHDSSRFSLDGGLKGMYFFGYGNFVYTHGTVQVELHRNLNFTAGYQIGTRLKIEAADNRVGLRLTQVGPEAGLEASW